MRFQQSLDPEERALAAMSDSPRGDWQDLTEQLGRVEAPALFVWGREDAFLTPDYPLMLSRMVPHGNLHVMDHVSHHLQEERPGCLPRRRGRLPALGRPLLSPVRPPSKEDP